MKEMIKKIREADDAFGYLFSNETRFSEHLYKQWDDEIPDMYDHNAFITDGMPSEAELIAAENFQKARGNDFFKIDSRFPLSAELIERFHLEEDLTYTMLLEKGHAHSWKRNPFVKIKSLKEDDIAGDILEVELKTYGEDYGEDFVRRKMRRYLAMSKKYENFYYFGAYIDDKIVGACYAFCLNGVVCIDGLAVLAEYRKQYVATTLLANIVDTFGENVYLHADAEDTPKEMYAKMGFDVVDKVYEYNYRD